MFRIEFKDCLATLFGGHAVTVQGSVQCDHGVITTLLGATGAGKTTLMSIIAHICGCPAFRAVDKVDHEGITLSHNIKGDHVGVVRQNPGDNFLGSCVGEEIELAFGISRLGKQEFQKRLEELWTQHFGEDITSLTRHPNRLSSGQQQILSIIVQVLRQPDILLADEPLSRLSVTNARRVMDLLSNLSEQSYVLLSSHQDALENGSSLVFSAPKYVVETNGTLMKVSNMAPNHIAENDLTVSDASTLLIDWLSYQKEKRHSQSFTKLPSRTVRVIEGAGERLFTKSLDLDVFMGGTRNPTTTARGLGFRKGINILYGDNGSGKTLIGRALCGDIPLNPPPWSLCGGFSRGANCAIFPLAAGDSIPGDATLAWLQRRRRCHFLSAIPDEALASTGTIEQEFKAVYRSLDDITTRVELIRALGLDPGRQIDTLSFGERKLVAFCMLRDNYSFIVLDELFANLSEATQSALGGLVLQRCMTGSWSVVVLTSNRPSNSIAILQRSAKAVGSNLSRPNND